MRWYRKAVVAAAVLGVVAGGVAVTLAAVGADGAAQARARWDARGPEHYRFVWSTYGMVGTTRTVVEVRDGRVVASTPLERNAAGRDGGPRTVEDVFARLDNRQQKAHVVEVEYDPELGYPASVQVDLDVSAMDDEHGFAVENLEPT